MNTVCRSSATVLVGSVEVSAEVDAVDVDVDVDAAVVGVVLAAEDRLAWRSTNSFCRAALKLDPLLLVEFTAPVVLAVLDDDGSVALRSVLLLVVAVLLLLPDTLL